MVVMCSLTVTLFDGCVLLGTGSPELLFLAKSLNNFSFFVYLSTHHYGITHKDSAPHARSPIPANTRCMGVVHQQDDGFEKASSVVFP